MLTITHKATTEGNSKIEAGTIIAGDKLAQALIAVGAASARRVITTRKHYCGAGADTRVYRERAEIESFEDAVCAIAMSRARLDPPFPGGFLITGVSVAGEAKTPLSAFALRASETAPEKNHSKPADDARKDAGESRKAARK